MGALLQAVAEVVVGLDHATTDQDAARIGTLLDALSALRLPAGVIQTNEHVAKEGQPEA